MSTRMMQARMMCYSADRKSTRLNSSHSQISYAVFCLKKKKADANGFYITTNAYPWTAVSFEFAGAQIYAFSKRQLDSVPASVSVTWIDASDAGHLVID